MRRSRALSLFGGFLAVVAVATVTARSHAANGVRARSAVTAGPAAHIDDMSLLPLLAKHDAALFGSFIKPGASPEVSPSEAACPPDMVDVEGDYCPIAEQKCVRWLDPATRLQCAEFEKIAGTDRMPSGHGTQALLRRPLRVAEQGGRDAAVHDELVRGQVLVRGDGQAPLRRQRVDARVRRPGAPPVSVRRRVRADDRACNIDKPYIWPQAERDLRPQDVGG